MTEILSDEAVAFVADLNRRFRPRRNELLEARARRRAEIAAGASLGFLAETADIRAAEWTAPPAPADLQDRRVEITGPTERKMTINALNSGAKVWLADLEDANTPHWSNVVDGQQNLHDAIRRTISLETPAKSYSLKGGPYRYSNSRALTTVDARPTMSGSRRMRTVTSGDTRSSSRSRRSSAPKLFQRLRLRLRYGCAKSTSGPSE